MAGDVERRDVVGALQADGQQQPLVVCEVLGPGRRPHGRRRHEQHVEIGQRGVVGAGQHAPQVLGAGVVAHAVVAAEVLAGEHGHLDRVGEPGGRVAPHRVHPARRARGRTRHDGWSRPRRRAAARRGPWRQTPFQIAMPSRCIGTETSVTSWPRPASPLGRRGDQRVDLRLGGSRDREGLAQDADAQRRLLAQRRRVAGGRHGALARVGAIGAGDRVEHQRAVGDRRGHRLDGVERQLDREDPV